MTKGVKKSFFFEQSADAKPLACDASFLSSAEATQSQLTEKNVSATAQAAMQNMYGWSDKNPHGMSWVESMLMHDSGRRMRAEQRRSCRLLLAAMVSATDLHSGEVKFPARKTKNLISDIYYSYAWLSDRAEQLLAAGLLPKEEQGAKLTKTQCVRAHKHLVRLGLVTQTDRKAHKDIKSDRWIARTKVRTITDFAFSMLGVSTMRQDYITATKQESLQEAEALKQRYEVERLQRITHKEQIEQQIRGSAEHKQARILSHNLHRAKQAIAALYEFKSADISFLFNTEPIPI